MGSWIYQTPFTADRPKSTFDLAIPRLEIARKSESTSNLHVSRPTGRTPGPGPLWLRRSASGRLELAEDDGKRIAGGRGVGEAANGTDPGASSKNGLTLVASVGQSLTYGKGRRMTPNSSNLRARSPSSI